MRCTAAVWHRPFASSGPNGSDGQMRDVWELLNEHGAELVISGHEHFYERFGPQDHDYRYTQDRGTAVHRRHRRRLPLSPRHPRSQYEVVVEAFGVLKLTLNPTAYDWEFIEASTSQVIDRGSESCH
jgi:hypothetical protein